MIKIMLVRRIDNDYNSWKKSFDSLSERMKTAGCLNYSTGTLQGDPKSIYIISDWENKENFTKFFNSKETQETVKKSGNKEPQITYLTELHMHEYVPSREHAHH